MQPVWLSGRQNGRIGHSLHHNEGSLPGRDGDAVRAFGVLIADAQRVARREGRIGQLVVGAAFADALGPALHGEDGKVEKFLFRVATLLTGADEGDAAALVLEGGADAPLFQPKAGAEVRQRVLQPFASQRPQQQYLGKALFRSELRRIFGIGIVLDVGQDDDIVLLRRAGRGIEVADDDVRLAAQRLAVAVARIARNDEVIGAEQTFQLRRDRARGKDHTA